ncbi:MAG: O-antigen ligase family protein, partial [Hyphomonadaceae bacterium]|nr:O-antigen ligase family protein [Hyphomonadaceae bacterium]
AMLVFGSVFVASAGIRTHRAVGAACVAAFVVLVVLFAVEVLGDMPLSRATAAPGAPEEELLRRIYRATTVLMALAFPAAGLLLAEGRTNAGRAILAAALLAMFSSSQSATLVAFVLGLGAFMVAYAAPRFAVLAVSGGLAFWVLAAPFLTPTLATSLAVNNLPDSWAARLGIWEYASARILEQPWIGHGLDASRAVTERIAISEAMEIRAIQVHPHSASLQVWYETGAVGAVLAAAALLAGGWSLSRMAANDRVMAATAAAALASLGFVANVSYSAWQEWWVATLFIAAASVYALRRSSS